MTRPDRPIARLAGVLAAAVLTLPAAAETLRLDAATAVQLAIEASALVDAADARIAGSEAAVAAADGARLPVVQASAKVAQRNPVPELSAPLGGPGATPVVIFPNIETTYSAALGVAQPLYAGGAITAGREASRLDLDATTADRRRTLADLRLAARLGYWRAVATAAEVDAARAREHRAERLLGDAEALRAAGMAVDADVLAARARLAAARVAVIRAATGVRDSEARLRSLLALSAGTVVELADARTAAVPPPPAPLGELTGAAASRPELVALDARISGLQARERALAAARRPSVSLAGEWDLARPNPRFMPLEDAWDDSWSVGVVANWILFDGHRTRSEGAVVRSERDALIAQRAEADRQIVLEVETARLDLAAALEAVPAADDSHAAAAARELASRERYDAGLAPIQEVLDAQSDLADAELEQIRIRTSAWISAAALDRACGR
jgi:outer membrane protein TolC